MAEFMDSPTERGWYWHFDGELSRMLFVCERPGHRWLAVQDEPNAITGKRQFMMAAKMGGQWFGPVMPPNPDQWRDRRAPEPDGRELLGYVCGKPGPNEGHAIFAKQTAHANTPVWTTPDSTAAGEVTELLDQTIWLAMAYERNLHRGTDEEIHAAQIAAAEAKQALLRRLSRREG